MEQTETPEMLAARNEQRRAQGLKKVGAGVALLAMKGGTVLNTLMRST